MKRVNSLSEVGALWGQSKAPAVAKVGLPSRSRRAGQIVLERSIDVRCWRVVGQVARAAKRTELIVVLKRALEAGQTDAEDVAKHLLFEPRSRLVVAQRLLAIAERYRLLESKEKRYVLTEVGREAVEKEQVFVPEHGTWTVWASEEPLLSGCVLHVEPWNEPTAFDEVNDKNISSKRPIGALPEWLLGASGSTVLPIVGGATLRIDELEKQGESVQPPKAALRAIWNVSEVRLRVIGELGDQPVDAVLRAPAEGADGVWMQLLQGEQLQTKWDSTVSALRIDFEEVARAEREPMKRAVVFKRPEIGGLGKFDETTVENVALRARSADDAERWVEWRLRERVRDYALSDRFDQWAREAVSPFEEFQPRVPTRSDLAELEKRDWPARPTPAAWHLVAAEDWSL